MQSAGCGPGCIPLGEMRLFIAYIESSKTLNGKVRRTINLQKRPQDVKQEVRKTINLGSKNTSQDAIHRMLSGMHFSGAIRWMHSQDAIHRMQSGMQSSGCCPQGRHAFLALAFRAFVRVSLIGSSKTVKLTSPQDYKRSRAPSPGLDILSCGNAIRLPLPPSPPACRLV
jgi:hypothetical protein